MLDRLEAAGFARRVPSPADRRALIVECTEAGRALERRVFGRVRENELDILWKIGVGRDRRLRSLLGKIVDNLEAAE